MTIKGLINNKEGKDEWQNQKIIKTLEEKENKLGWFLVSERLPKKWRKSIIRYKRV